MPRGLQPAAAPQVQRKKRSFFSKKSTLPPLPIIRTRSPPRSVPSATVLHSLEPDMKAVTAGKTFMKTEMGEDKWEVADRTRVTRAAAAEAENKPIAKRRVGASTARKAPIAKVTAKHVAVGPRSAPASAAQSAKAKATVAATRIKLRTRQSPGEEDTAPSNDSSASDVGAIEDVTSALPQPNTPEDSPATESAQSAPPAPAAQPAPTSSRTRQFWSTTKAPPSKEAPKEVPPPPAPKESPTPPAPKETPTPAPVEAPAPKAPRPTRSTPAKQDKAISSPATRAKRRNSSDAPTSRSTRRKSNLGPSTDAGPSDQTETPINNVPIEEAGPSSSTAVTEDAPRSDASPSAVPSSAVGPSTVTVSAPPETPAAPVNPANPSQKKEYLSAGMFCDEPVPPRDYQLVNRVLATRQDSKKKKLNNDGELDRRYVSDDTSFPPLPEPKGMVELFEKEHEFKLPYDLVWESESGILDDKKRPPQYEMITSSESIENSRKDLADLRPIPRATQDPGLGQGGLPLRCRHWVRPQLYQPPTGNPVWEELSQRAGLWKPGAVSSPGQGHHCGPVLSPRLWRVCRRGHCRWRICGRLSRRGH